ncbi:MULTISPECIES: hypothetical protein [Vibrio]|nr:MULTISPECIES: hypothetical protein [Vibrio]
MTQGNGNKGTGMDGYRPVNEGYRPPRNDQAGYQPPKNQTKPGGTPPKKP